MRNIHRPLYILSEITLKFGLQKYSFFLDEQNFMLKLLAKCLLQSCEMPLAKFRIFFFTNTFNP
jgi:hypothetical protein